MKITSYILKVLVILFLLFDAYGKLAQIAAVTKASAELGLPGSLTVPIGVILLVCTVLYALPAAAPLGALLLTGYLGGAIAIQLRAGNPVFESTVFPLLFAALAWAPLFLRDSRARNLFRFSSSPP